MVLWRGRCQSVLRRTARRRAQHSEAIGASWSKLLELVQRPDPPESERFHENGLPKACFWGGRYVNTWDPYCCDRGPMDTIMMAMEGGLPRLNEEMSMADIQLLLPIVKTDWNMLREAKEAPGNGEIAAVWAGHASVLLVLDGITFLTDPVFGEHCSPVDFGPRRYIPAPFQPGEVPFDIDVVLISHNHFDHLCGQTVQKILHASGAKQPLFVVPRGVKSTVQDFGVPAGRIIDLSWWEQIAIKRIASGLVWRKCGTASEVQRYGVGMRVAEEAPSEEEEGEEEARVVFTPAQHWSARSIFDKNMSLWGSYVVEGSKRDIGTRQRAGRFFFAGDTGYCPVFRQIGELFGPFDISALPLGAYAPKWFMKAQHVDPFEAVRIHEELRSSVSFGIHWGTWPLAKDGPLDPLYELQSVLKPLRNASAVRPHEPFVALKAGGSVQVKPLDGGAKEEEAHHVKSTGAIDLLRLP